MKISDYIKEDTTATFSYCDGEALWYVLSGTFFIFPVPLEETKGATFKVRDKAVFFMRWVRKQLEYWEKEQEMIQQALQEHLADLAKRAEEEKTNG